MIAPDSIQPNGCEVYRVDTDKRRDEWLALRTRDLTTGDIAGICGASKWATPLSVYARKKGLLPPQEETELMDAGRHWEKAVLSKLCAEFPEWDIRDANIYVRDPERRIGATHDFVANRPDVEGIGCIDAKCVAHRSVIENWQDGDKKAPLAVPLGYQLQVIVQAKLIGATWGGIALYEMGEFKRTFHYLPVEISGAAWERIVAEAEAFWRMFDAGIHPDAIPARDAETIAALYATTNNDEPPIDLTCRNDLPELLAERDMLKDRIINADTRIDEIDTIVKTALGEHAQGITADGRKVSWKTQHRKEYTVAARDIRVLRIGKPLL